MLSLSIQINISDPIAISNILNRYFASVGPKLAKKLPPVQRLYIDFLSQTKSLESSFFHNPVTPEEVQLETASIRNNNYHSLYSCSSQLLESCSSNITSGVLAKVITACILNGVYHSKLKMVNIVAVYKADD